MPDADLDPPAAPDRHPDGTPCDGCGDALAADQRYCLGCGRRHGPARLDVLAIARAVVRPPRTAASGDAPAAPAPWRAPALPGPRVGALLAGAMLVAGLGLGAAAGPDAPASQAAAGGRRVIAIVRAPTVAAPLPVPAPASTATPAPGRSHPAPAAVPADAGAAAAPSPPPGPAPVASPGPAAPSAAPAAPVSKLPPVRHVWVISLTAQRYEETWGPQAAEPEFTALRAEGTLLPRSFAVAHGSLAGGVALLSGQGPNPATQAGCPAATPLAPGAIDPKDAQGQAAGTGCVYPATVATLADQLTGAGLTWKAYVESIASPDPGAAQTCRHADPGQPDPFAAPRPGDPYLTSRNPFVFFATIAADPVCATNVVGLDRLAPDLARADATPAFSYIVPDTCHDGRDVPCADGAPAGLAASGPWLKGIVDEIRATSAYRKDGLILITGDQAPADGPRADSRACRCAPARWPNTPDAGSPAAPGRGGGRVGTVLLSPFVTPGATVPQSYDQVSILKSIEDLYGLTHLGAAADPAHRPLGPKVFARYTPPAP